MCTEDENRAQVAILINYAQGVADSLGITLSQAPRVLPNRHGWLDHDRLIMDAYRQQHAKLKNALLADSQHYISTSARNFRHVRFAAVLLAVAGALSLLLAVKLNHRITRMLHTENERLEREVRDRTEELVGLATYLTNVREEEKQHLGRELHDEMGALLTAAKLDANWLERKLAGDGQVAERLARLQQTLTAGITLKRRITNDLRPALLYDLGLVDALRLLAEEFGKAEEAALTLNLPEARSATLRCGFSVPVPHRARGVYQYPQLCEGEARQPDVAGDFNRDRTVDRGRWGRLRSAITHSCASRTGRDQAPCVYARGQARYPLGPGRRNDHQGITAAVIRSR